MGSFIYRFLEFLAFMWLARLVMRVLFGGAATRMDSGQFPRSNPGAQQPGQKRVVVTGEMKKDPQCGTYVATELAIKHRIGNEVVHFCSTECEQEYLRSASGKSA